MWSVRSKGLYRRGNVQITELFSFSLSHQRLVICCFLLFGFKHEVPDKIESALTTIMGTIVGFYFTKSGLECAGNITVVGP